MDRLKNIINKIKEFIDSFVNPIEPEKSLKELALEAGISGPDLDILEKSSNGVNWKFSDENNKTTKNAKIAGVESKQKPIQTIGKIQSTERKIGRDRDE